ncbi:MAG: DmsE family decaheme c-type cytochrome [Gammaproteobacteria bacterium]|nr:DmsE family decaheme c-type cytochrome [Gammaproteobacteria bacterium]
MRNHQQESRKKPSTLITVMLFWCCCVSLAVADDIQVNDQNLYSRKGADTCLKCHDEDYKYPIFPIFYNKHGNRNDPRSPMAQLQCESCHGPGRAHATEPKVGFDRAPIISFGRNSPASKDKQNGQCLQCHNDHGRQNWAGSAHERQDMLCVDCHKLHERHDPVLQITQQSEFCYGCHKKQRAEFARTSVHPVRYEKMECTQCHNPHGAVTDAMLKTNTKNDTCYRCHAEKRGPYLWTHAPVAENCGLCHEHHGSIHTPLLKKRVPLLCQECHTSTAHARNPYDGSAVSSQSAFVLAKGCLNCHSQVHGSNHPSGVKLMR